MNPEQQALWKQADEVFASLLQQRAKPSKEAVGELGLPADLQTCVLALLDGFYADGPVDGQASDLISAIRADSHSGRNIGGWILDEPIGTGGMATVHRAYRATEDFEQVAAVKLLGGAQLSSEGAVRFEREKRILAGLSHPNIASLLDAGFADDGTPFIAMEYVDGKRIDDYVVENVPQTRDRVRLFLRVCQAVAFAQQNLIVHRDIKPSNILVDTHGEVKLLDFGIARLLSAEDDATTTRAYTPGYAAPEQLAGLSVTTATDVYGLGAVLHRLVDGQAATESGQPKPALSTTAIRSVADPDLANIIQMALREEPEHRYPAAQALHDDLLAWLESRPVNATGGALNYRLRKFIRRNRTLVAGAAVALVVGAVGLAATLWQAKLAEHQSLLAAEEAKTAQAVTRYVQSMMNMLTPATPAQRAIDGERMLSYFLQRSQEELAETPLAAASVQFALANLASEMGLYARATRVHEQALATRHAHLAPGTLAIAESELALAMLESLPGTERVELSERFRSALAVVGEQALGTDLHLNGLIAFATHLTRLAKVDEAREVFRQAALIATTHSSNDRLRADLLMAEAELNGRLGEASVAIDQLSEAIALLQPIVGSRHATIAHAKATLGFIQSAQLGQPDLGLENLRSAVALDELIYASPTSQTILHLGFLAIALAETGDFPGAIEIEQKRLQQARSVVGDPSREVAVSLRNLGTHYLRSKRPELAERYYRQSLATHRRFDPDFHPGVVVSLVSLATALEHQGRFAAAIELMRQAVDGFEMWGQGSDTFLAEQHTRLAQYEALQGQLEAAAARLESTRSTLVGDPRLDLADSRLAEVLLRQGHRTEAVRLLTDVIPRLRTHSNLTWGALAEAQQVFALALCPSNPGCKQAYETAMESLLDTFALDHWRVRELQDNSADLVAE